ncbi:hypothetical protein BDF20DRAFT_267571 [Mycotypha africana]|uniref:uncharacterized protein n=1 Tax=Mycotypha africana TaxID=64632 RepID=UPI0022FFFFF7|nr:uncharacterized protein BDF20DRAFT_267571 [Mycotypha africana]KAI8987482.1 hypothetical protein BDF20DRAFT_267571 [Mycotypha africana]
MFNNSNLFNKPATNAFGSSNTPATSIINSNTGLQLGQPNNNNTFQALQQNAQQLPTLQPQTQAQAHPEAKTEESPKLKQKEQSPASLRQILERSRLTNHKINSSSVPTIERGLTQIESQSKKLSSKTLSTEENVDIRAHYFLAQGGINTQVLVKELGTIHLGGLGEYRQPIQDTNIEDYLKQQNTETVLALVQDGRQEIVESTENAFKEDLDSYWKTFLEKELKVNDYSSESLQLSKSKFDASRVVSAGMI